MVRAQIALLEQLGIQNVFLAIGGSIGGMQVLEWTIQAQDRVFAAVPIAVGAAPVSAEHRLLRDWPPGDHGRSELAQGRHYLARRHAARSKGLAVARMAAHITYLSETAPAAEIRPQPAGPRSPRHSASTPTSRSKAICATRARPSSTGSTPTPISTSPARWIISTCASEHGGVLANAFQGLEQAVLRLRLLLRLALPAGGKPQPRARAQRRRLRDELRQHRDGQGPRRLLRGGARIRSRPARLHRRRRQRARAAGRQAYEIHPWFARHAARRPRRHRPVHQQAASSCSTSAAATGS